VTVRLGYAIPTGGEVDIPAAEPHGHRRPDAGSWQDHHARSTHHAGRTGFFVREGDGFALAPGVKVSERELSVA
jgi:hypothetical protein